jgi:simple sugar transport system substrate-binding protein
VVQKAKAAGIPVVALNSGFTQWQKLGALMYFGQDEELAGQAGGQRLSQEGAKHVICIAPEQGNVSIDARCRGAKNDFSGKLETLYVNGSDLPSVETTVAAKLKQDPSIDYLLAQGAPVTLTSVKSVAGANSPAKIVAFDLNPQVVEPIKGGQVQWTIDQQPYVQGFLAIDSLWLYLANGNTVGGGKEVLTGPAFVSKDNIDQVAKYAEGGIR